MAACSWPGENSMMREYHDEEWCIPSHDDRYLFEMITLEGAQSGLSWNIVLSKREEYQKAFHSFNLVYCSKLKDEEIERIIEEFKVVKHLAKLKSVRSNAQAIMEIQSEFGSFSDFLWTYVDFKPMINYWESEGDAPSRSTLSEKISKDLKKRNFKFVGPVTIYSFMQAIGMVDDHVKTCPYHSSNRSL